MRSQPASSSPLSAPPVAPPPLLFPAPFYLPVCLLGRPPRLLLVCAPSLSVLCFSPGLRVLPCAAVLSSALAPVLSPGLYEFCGAPSVALLVRLRLAACARPLLLPRMLVCRSARRSICLCQCSRSLLLLGYCARLFAPSFPSLVTAPLLLPVRSVCGARVLSPPTALCGPNSLDVVWWAMDV